MTDNKGINSGPSVTKSGSSQSINLDSLLKTNDQVSDNETMDTNIDELLGTQSQTEDSAKGTDDNRTSPSIQKAKKPRRGRDTGNNRQRTLSQSLISFKKPISPPIDGDFQNSLADITFKFDNLKCKYDTKLQSLENTTQKLTEENKQLRDQVRKLEMSKDELSGKLAQFGNKISETEQNASYAVYKASVAINKVDELEQHGRLNTIRVYGVQDNNKSETTSETANEVISLLENQLDLSIEREDIDIAHRLGVFDKDPAKKRAIICKFVRRTDKQDVIKRRKVLRGKGIVIVEDLTQDNKELLDKVYNKDNITQAWSSNGKIFGKKEDGQVIRFEQEIKNYIKNFEQQLYNNRVGNQHSTDSSENEYNMQAGMNNNINNYDGYRQVNRHQGHGRGRGQDSRRSFNPHRGYYKHY